MHGWQRRARVALRPAPGSHYFPTMSNAPARSLSIALAQLNPVLGDLAGNLAKLRRVRADAAGKGADLLVLPELYVCGYPPEDLVRKPAFAAACRAAVEQLATDLGP